MGNVLTPESPRELVNQEDEICVSVSMPLQTPSVKAPRRQENVIRYKNLLSDVQDTLQKQGHRDESEVEQLLAPLREELNNGHVPWVPAAAGFTAHVSSNHYAAISLWTTPPERIYVGSRFYLKPVLASLSKGQSYYVLGLDQKRVRLYRGDPVRFFEVTPERGFPTVPQIFAQAELERHLNTPGGLVPRFGHGPGEEDIKKRIVEFLQRVDEVLRETMAGFEEPVIPAGVEYITSHFRKITKAKHVLPESVHGSIAAMSQEELHRRASQIASEHKTQELQRHLLRVREADNAHRSADIEGILKAAYEGRVQTLLIAEDSSVPGRFDEAQEKVEAEKERQASTEHPGDDLLDLAAFYTLRSHGDVLAIPKEEILDGQPIAALLRG